MAGGIAVYGANLTLDAVFGSGTPATLYIALLLSEPDEEDTGSDIDEVTGGSYARVASTNDATNWPAAVNGQQQNGQVITFPTATADWGSVSHVAICDASTGGNLICWGALTIKRSVISGRSATIAVSSLAMSLETQQL